MILIRLVYTSSATLIPTDSDLITLLKMAQARNLRQNITGMLLYGIGTYLQVLEGEAEDVHDVYQSILNDDRSNHHVTLIEEEITKRDFPNWTMGFRNVENCEPKYLPDGFVDVFDGQWANDFATKKSVSTVKLLLSFSKHL